MALLGSPAEERPDIKAGTLEQIAISGRNLVAFFGADRIIERRWDRVSLPEGRMTIKTEHHREGGMRIVPIFSELRPFLEAAWDTAPPTTTLSRRAMRALPMKLCRGWGTQGQNSADNDWPQYEEIPQIAASSGLVSMAARNHSYPARTRT